eukprot:CAMPEP_0119115638 /NCGR_PEP_ID=MMETSP1180-20130426/51682_1 /TAXON_ID=3052 ORGANISM="Chlamydomonas cf sp, Strain CCMP681" /NCGR_SAMPLE_ID=MMETSP1180 /ASSEMBLY_ACC=CAM_ASM_000741 /LENGTH=90 /DNA_ID=CAMNT_0007104713 /DNA_START=30 /DNA_END=298 /DNA_ORIENTATION=-
MTLWSVSSDDSASASGCSGYTSPDAEHNSCHKQTPPFDMLTCWRVVLTCRVRVQPHVSVTYSVSTAHSCARVCAQVEGCEPRGRLRVQAG